MTIRHGGNNIPPTRLCTCGHTYHLHRGGHCRVIHGCTCTQFTEQPPAPAMYPTRPAKGHEQ